MKLAFVMHNLIRGDGQGRIQYEIVRHVLREGHEAVLFADRVDPEVEEWGARWVRVSAFPRRPNLPAVYHFAVAADRALARSAVRFDRVIGAGFTMRGRHDLSLCQFVHAAWLKSPVHVSRVQSGPMAWYQWLYSRCNARWELQSFANSRKIVAPSRKITDELLGIGIPHEKIELIYNGVDLDEFKPGVVAREELGLPASVPMALFCGDIRTPRKNLDSVLKAVARLPLVHLAVVGAAERSPFPKMARDLGIAQRVHFAGYRRDVSRFMQACDLFVFPSRYEAGTLVLIEALASGLPVVTARTAGGCEIMNSECGTILESPEDIPGIAAAMERYLADRAALAAAAAEARRVASQYSWTSMAGHYLRLLETAPAHAVA
jgi:glycosyltransferase involved in cell wall biosynthesis